MSRYTEIRSFALVAEKGSFAAASVIEGVTPVVMGRRLDAVLARQRLDQVPAEMPSGFLAQLLVILWAEMQTPTLDLTQLERSVYGLPGYGVRHHRQAVAQQVMQRLGVVSA